MHINDDRQFLKERASIEFAMQWANLKKEAPIDDIPKLIEQIKSFEAIQNNNRAIVLFEAKNFRPLYWGGSFEKLFGYASEEIKIWNISFFFKSIVWEHIDFPLKFLKWGKKINTAHPLDKSLLPARSYFCGVKTRHKKKHIVRIFVDQVILSARNGQPSLSLVFMEDIQHLMKDSVYWSRYVRGSFKEKTYFFRSKGQKKEFSDIITSREKEILIEIIKGHNSKEIAKKLNISLATVTTHRKNMIARSGAKNTTALIQLCKLCNVI